MSEIEREGDEEFAERMARVLRVPETLGDSFEEDLVRAIRADRQIDQPSPRRPTPLTPAWWRTPAIVRMSPAVGLALAASLVVAASLGTLGVALKSYQRTGMVVAERVHDTVHVVRFVFVGKVNSVSLVGDFNGWGAMALPLVASGSGETWVVNVPLPRGRHEYAFVVDGKRWVADPFGMSNTDDFNTESSIIAVGS
jgi:hypothetical protein